MCCDCTRSWKNLWCVKKLKYVNPSETCIHYDKEWANDRRQKIRGTK